LLAKLFAKPSNLLVMDEPTNDLDVETLELLEEILADYPGTLILVSHDRAFLDNVVTSTLVMEGNGRIGEYIGGYVDWLRQRSGNNSFGSNAAKPVEVVKAALTKVEPATPAKRKLSFKEAKELEALPLKIEQLENQIADMTSQMAEPSFYSKNNAAAITEFNSKMAALQVDLDATYSRWQMLEAS